MQEDDDASLKEAWLERQKVEWENNQRLRQQRAALAKAPAAVKGASPAMPTEAEVKRDWLRRKRTEHEARLRQMEALKQQQQQPASAVPNQAPLPPDEASMKREWLRRKRLEHEAALQKRCAGLGAHLTAPTEPDAAAMKRAWLQRKREEHERSLADRSALAAAEGSETAPLVDAALLSSFGHEASAGSEGSEGAAGRERSDSSERERYMQQLHDEKSAAQRERRRMSSDALRRPSLPPSLDGDERTQEELKQELLALSSLDDEQYAYYFNYAEKYDDEKDEYHRRMRGDLSGETSAAGSSRSNTTAGVELGDGLGDGLDDLELSFARALETIESSHLPTHNLAPHNLVPPAVQARSPNGGRYPLSFGSSPGVLPPARRHSAGYGQGRDDATDHPALLAASPGISPNGAPSPQRNGGGSGSGSGSTSFSSGRRTVGGHGAADGVSWGVVGGGGGHARRGLPSPAHQTEAERLIGLSRGSPPPRDAWIDAGSGGSSSTGSHSPLHSPLRYSPTPGSTRASEVLRLEDITVLRRR